MIIPCKVGDRGYYVVVRGDDIELVTTTVKEIVIDEYKTVVRFKDTMRVIRYFNDGKIKSDWYIYLDEQRAKEKYNELKRN